MIQSSKINEASQMINYHIIRLQIKNHFIFFSFSVVACSGIPDLQPY